MQIRRLKKQVVIDRLDDFSLEMLRLIPSAADPAGNREVEERLFSSPEAVPGKLTEDWEAFVKPELRHLFQSSLTTVEADVAGADRTGAEEEDVEYMIRVPENHIDAWINAINQARLVIATRNGFSSRDLESVLPASIQTPREMALLQIHLYDFLLVNFVEATGE